MVNANEIASTHFQLDMDRMVIAQLQHGHDSPVHLPTNEYC